MNKSLNHGLFILLTLLIGWSCSTTTKEDPKPIVKPDEPEYIEWSYETGKDPLIINLFTFETGLDTSDVFDVSDTLKLQNVFEGHLEGYDYYKRYQKLDMTKNSWNEQVFPKVPIKITGHEFSANIRDELFAGVKFTNAADNNILVWARDNFSDWHDATRAKYLKYIKPKFEENAEKYLLKNGKKPKYQVGILQIPLEYHESGYGGTVVTFSDGNVLVITIEPLRKPDYGDLEQVLNMYAGIGHEFAGHQLESSDNTNFGFADYVGKKDQFGNEVDGFGHVNGPAPQYVFNGGVSTHLRPDRGNCTLLFPQENKEFLSAYVKNNYNNPSEHKSDYSNLRLMKTPAEKSNIPYIADMVPKKQAKAEVFMKEMWTDKILKNKKARVSATSEMVRIKSIISCDL